MRKKKYCKPKFYIIGISLFMVLISFQNCGELTSKDYIQNESLSEEDVVLEILKIMED